VNLRQQEAERTLRAAVAARLQAQPDLWRRVMALGLDHQVGAGGRQLPLVQRQQANLARALLRRAEVYVLNRPLAALDPALQATVVARTLAHLQAAGGPAVAWVLSNAGLADHFDRDVTIQRGRLARPGDGATAMPLAGAAASVG
jgi:putative ABC transport system ATP-binding protein